MRHLPGSVAVLFRSERNRALAIWVDVACIRMGANDLSISVVGKVSSVEIAVHLLFRAVGIDLYPQIVPGERASTLDLPSVPVAVLALPKCQSCSPIAGVP